MIKVVGFHLLALPTFFLFQSISQAQQSSPAPSPAPFYKVADNCWDCNLTTHEFSVNALTLSKVSDGCNNASYYREFSQKALSPTEYESALSVTQNMSDCRGYSDTMSAQSHAHYDFLNAASNQLSISDPSGILDGWPGLSLSGISKNIDTPNFIHKTSTIELVRVPKLTHRLSATGSVEVIIYDDSDKLENLSIPVGLTNYSGAKVTINPSASAYSKELITWTSTVIGGCDQPYLSEMCPNDTDYNKKCGPNRYVCTDFSRDAISCLTSSGIGATTVNGRCAAISSDKLHLPVSDTETHALILVPSESICQGTKKMCFVEPQNLKSGTKTDGLKACYYLDYSRPNWRPILDGYAKKLACPKGCPSGYFCDIQLGRFNP